MTSEKTLVLGRKQIHQKLQRIAHELYENHFSEKELVIVGISGQGYLLAKRITAILKKKFPIRLHLGELKLDKRQPIGQPHKLTGLKTGLENKSIVLIDDVLNSGKTLIYGAKILLDHSLKRVTTVVFVNRRHRLFPIRADIVGLTLSTTLQEHITVILEKGKEAVYLE